MRREGSNPKFKLFSINLCSIKIRLRDGSREIYIYFLSKSVGEGGGGQNVLTISILDVLQKKEFEDIRYMSVP